MSKEVKDALEAAGQTIESGEVERFYNKENNFSISWYKDIKTLYNATMEKQIEVLASIKAETKATKEERNAAKKNKQKLSRPDKLKQNIQVSEEKANMDAGGTDWIRPSFIVAHELFDALPIH